MRRIPEVSSLTKLDRRAAFLEKLSRDAWEELPDGVLRVSLKSPQFALVGFREDLTALAEREGYEVTEKIVKRGEFLNGTAYVQEGWLVMTPRKGALS